MKWSMGFPLTGAAGGSGFSDHQSPLGAAAAFSRGSGAPRFTHSSSSAISAAGSFSFGIFKSGSVCRMARTSRLFSTSPGMTAGPFSPPSAQPLRASSVSPPFIFPD